MEWVIYLVLGAFAGLLAGLFGVGGGAVIVPTLIIVFSMLQLAPELTVYLALGTSFATIVVTSLSSILAHHRRGNIHWSIWKVMMPGLAVGVLLGSLLAMRVDGALLQVIIAVFFMLIALQMFFKLHPKSLTRRFSDSIQLMAGSVIGFMSAFFGIGGGSLTVPWLSMNGEPMKHAVATSAACGLPIAVAGAISYGLLGPSLPDIQWSTGYIYWPAFVGIALASTPMTKVGASLATSLPEPLLKKLFSILLFSISIHLLIAH